MAWVTEHEIIAQWQTPLNYPRATALIKKTALGFRISSKRRASLYGTFGLRLWRKLHKRMHRRNQRFFIKNSREFAWGLLFKLGSRTRAAFETSKLLRSRRTADEEVYALIKLSRNIEDPHRNRVQGLLKSVAKCRTKMHWPKTSRPWVFCHCATRHSRRSVKVGCETLSFSTNICLLPFMFPRTASERCRINVSRSFFTTSSLGKKPCGTQPSNWIPSHVRVLSVGTNYRTDASLQAMWPLASKNSKLCCPAARTLLRPVLRALFSRAATTGCPSPAV